VVTFSRAFPLVLLFAAWSSIAEEGSTLLIDNTQGIDNTLDSAVTELNELTDSLRDPESPSTEPAITEETREEITETIPDSDLEGLSEPTILIDNTQGIDTLDTETAESIDSTPDAELEGLSEPTILIDNTRGIDTIDDQAIDAVDDPITKTTQDTVPTGLSEPIILIDKTIGIDKTLAPEVTEIQELSKSLKDTESTKPADNLQETVEEPIIAQPAEKSPIQPSLGEPVVTTKPKATLPKIIPRVIETEEQKTAATEKWTPRDNDLRILEIRVGQYKLEDVIPAYKYEDVVLLPLGTMSELLDIAIETKPGFAQGFIFKEEWTFMLDITRAEVVLQGKPSSYDRALVHELEDDIYVESNLLSKWMLMSLDIDLFSSRMWITSDEKLPFIKRLEREQRIAKSLSRLNLVKDDYPRHHEPYKDWSIPFIDQTVAAGLAQDKDGDTSLIYNYTTHVSADLLKHESTWFLNGDDQDTIDDFRVTLARHDDEAELLGFMKARKYAFGNVPEPRLNLITASSSLEPGVAVSNYPLGRQVEYDKRRFRGRLLPGWEVELYQNNALIGYQNSPVDGLYDFPDIPLLFGKNHFRLVFYGPQGQIREEDEHYNVNQSLTKKGEHYYFATSTSDEDGGNRTTAQYDYGITENISSSFALVSIPLDDGANRDQHNYMKAGMRGFWDSYLVALDFIDDSASGTAIQLDVQTQVDSLVVGVTDVQFSDFFSEEFVPTAVQLSRRTNINLNTAIPPSFLPRIPVDFGLRRDEFEDGGNLTEFTNRLSVNARGYAITNNLTRQKTTGLDPLFNGAVQVSTNINRYRLRGSVDYEFEPDTELTNLAATLDPGMYKDYNLSFGITHSLDQDLTEYSASANKATGKYNLSFGARYNSDNELNLDVAFSVGFGYEPRRNQWDSNASTVANQGTVSARVFLDSNQDGIYGENDEPLENVGFKLNGGYNPGRTADDGIVFLTGLNPYEPLNVVISPETMSDPLWTAALEGIQVTPRPGHAILLEYPVFMSGEIDGTVYLRRNNKEHGVGKVIVELVDEQGRALKTAETAYDGFYVMSDIPLGKYRMRVSEKQLDKLSLKLESEEQVEITNENQFINGVDFVLSPK
jgi:hypothetical protein